MNAEEGYQKLLEHYPNCIHPGLILGDAEAIVGQFGLEIITIDKNFIKHRQFYKENERIIIIKFTETALHIDVGYPESFAASYEKFKGFSFKNNLFI